MSQASAGSFLCSGQGSLNRFLNIPDVSPPRILALLARSRKVTRLAACQARLRICLLALSAGSPAQHVRLGREDGVNPEPAPEEQLIGAQADLAHAGRNDHRGVATRVGAGYALQDDVVRIQDVDIVKPGFR